MSGAFEIAAGAFAIVGVADVIIRTGREVSNFISEVVDAPKQLATLREYLQEIEALAGASKQCLDKLNARAQKPFPSWVIAPLDSSLRALKREILGLKLHLSKLKGNKKTWDRIKYVLDERKLDRALNSIEQSKTSLANAFVMVYGELSTTEHAVLDANHHALAAKLDDHHKQSLAGQDSVQKLIISRFDAQHQQLSANNSANQHLVSHLENIHQQNLSSTHDQQQGMSSVLHGQQRGLINQDQLLRTSTRTHKQVSLISKNLHKANNTSSRDHKVTRDMVTNLSSKVDQLEISFTKYSTTTRKSGRQIYFIGERRDMIMAYLLTVKEQLRFATDQILSQNIAPVSARQACWLETEIQNLLASAAQEEAARHPNSAAIPFDQWSFSEDIIVPSRHVGSRRLETLHDESHKHRPIQHKGKELQVRKRSTQARRVLSFNTPAGLLSISFPGDGTGLRHFEEPDDISLSFTSGIDQSFPIIHAHFFHKMMNARRPELCAQLNVFTVIPDDQEEMYYELFRRGSVQEIDAAFRRGIISPYHADSDGFNQWLMYTLANARYDVLQYSYAQGIGVHNLRDDVIVVATVGISFYHADTDFEDLKSIVDRVLDDIVDPSDIFAYFSNCVIGYAAPIPWQIVKHIVDMLSTIGYDYRQHR
ncbi:Nn.00g024810.m01.CDS01 [Neocucurbitaria sp. VM-36]